MDNQGSVKVSSLFSAKEIVCGLRSESLEECIRLLVKRLATSKAIPDADAALRGVLEREALGRVLRDGLGVAC